VTELVVLALNPGSSSLKAAVRAPDLQLSVAFDRVGANDLSRTLGQVAEVLADKDIRPEVVVHRVVHGGPSHLSTTRVDDGLLADLRAAVPLAPLHLPSDIASIEQAISRWPDATHVACFDTAFHAGLPERSTHLPVAAELADLGIRRYGFHGLSVQSVLRARPDLSQLVVAHLGSGCSVTAVADGRPRHTTMSLTPTGGMMSSTRSGDLDPEIVLYLLDQAGLPVDRLRNLLDRQSGLAGLADGRRDIRDLVSATDDAARLALDVFVHQAAGAIATCAIALDRFDTFVFTGGVGEHSGPVRQRICELLLRLRAEPDSAGPAGAAVDPVTALEASGVRVLVVPADEESVLDEQARALVARDAGRT
jgi:acetate kinase